MSLEVAIQENTVALRDLLAAIKANATVAAPVPAVKEAAAPSGKPKATSAEKAATPAPTPRTAAEAEAAAPEKKAEQSATTPPAAASPATPKADAPTYQDAATAITKLSREKGRDTAVALLAKFGAANLKEVKPEQFADVIAAATEAMGA